MTKERRLRKRLPSAISKLCVATSQLARELFKPTSKNLFCSLGSQGGDFQDFGLG
jgi:hypothetical protein